jgi:hypothetical protein
MKVPNHLSQKPLAATAGQMPQKAAQTASKGPSDKPASSSRSPAEERLQQSAGQRFRGGIRQELPSAAQYLPRGGGILPVFTRV